MISAACVAVLFLIGPIPQDLGYHDFADKRQFFGIVNFNDVLSNAPFLLFGIYGFINIQRKKILRHVKPQYIIFCAGVLLTGFGSAYYHLNPDNNTLVWDRLPMTVAFMSVFSVVIVEYLNHDAGRKMFIPLLKQIKNDIKFFIYSPSDVEKPKRDFIPRGVKFILSDIELIEPEKNRVTLTKDKQVISYDYLVIATGTSIQPSETEGCRWKEDRGDNWP